MLRDPLTFTLLNADGDASFFATNDVNFGGNVTLQRIAAAGGSAKGLRISSPGGKTVALSCREAFWDINFMLAGSGVTTGDVVSLVMQPDESGRGVIELAQFTVGPGGATLAYLEPSAKLYANGHIQQNVGAFLPYNFAAGASGRRTDQITIALSMDPKAPTMGCLYLLAGMAWAPLPWSSITWFLSAKARTTVQDKACSQGKTGLIRRGRLVTAFARLVLSNSLIFDLFLSPCCILLCEVSFQRSAIWQIALHLRTYFTE